MDLGGAEGREAVHEGDADVDFGSLAVGVSGADALSEGFQAAHLRFDPTSGVIARPALPEGPAIVSGGAQSFVADACRRTVFLPQSSILADRNDRDRVAREDRAVAPARVTGTIGGHGADLFVFGNLVQQIWQDGAITVSAGGELDRTDVGCSRVHGQMYFAPLASALNTMLRSLPLAIAEELDASAVHEQVQRSVSTAVGNLNCQGLLPATQGGKVGHRPVLRRQLQQAGHHAGGLAQRELEQYFD